MAVKEVIKTVEERIVEYMASKGIMLSWLAKKIDISVSHLHHVLKGDGNLKRELTDENLEKINIALEKEFKR